MFDIASIDKNFTTDNNMPQDIVFYDILSNRNDITFEQAWKAGGLSSNTEDYFDVKDAIIVGQK